MSQTNEDDLSRGEWRERAEAEVDNLKTMLWAAQVQRNDERVLADELAEALKAADREDDSWVQIWDTALAKYEEARRG